MFLLVELERLTFSAAANFNFSTSCPFFDLPPPDFGGVAFPKPAAMEVNRLRPWCKAVLGSGAHALAVARKARATATFIAIFLDSIFLGSWGSFYLSCQSCVKIPMHPCNP